ncbi:hypothetical protein D3C72_2299380 [compost metagenome]
MVGDDAPQRPAGPGQVIGTQLGLRGLYFLDDQHPVELGHLRRYDPGVLAGMIADRVLQRVEHVCL